MQNERNYISTKEAADKLGCSIKTVQRLLRKGELSGVRLGRRWYVNADFAERSGSHHNAG